MTGNRSGEWHAGCNPVRQQEDCSAPAGSTPSMDGTSLRCVTVANYKLVGSMPSSMEARSLVASADLIYLGSRNGAVEIWSREKLTRTGYTRTGTLRPVPGGDAAAGTDRQSSTAGSRSARMRAVNRASSCRSRADYWRYRQ
ncbi:hypothetical protein SETIT_9G517200v2 [Setaria italica]|uniref:Uncharacterized protein n=1 Tax=Setaria italica TaxID=4555 RepID=K4AGE5_SETIT|nr:hypothetical protein SETIT_9G517200v2 [Setaria italica]